MLESAAQLYCKPQVGFTVRQWHIDGKTILEARIEKSSSPPHYARSEDGKWLAYIRVNDENMLANNIMIKVWKRRNRPNQAPLSDIRKKKNIVRLPERKRNDNLIDVSAQLKAIPRSAASLTAPTITFLILSP
jgi:predicted HTH transcriptional regulator